MRHEAWFAGVDWASEAHHVCVVGGDGSKREERIFRHGGAGLAEMADWIAARCGGAAPEDVPVAIEIPHGPVVESLMDHGFAVYSINPKQLDRFRDRHSPAGAKDDSLDARVLADALRTDLHHFRRIDPVDPVVIELRAWSRIDEELTRDRTRLSNRVREQLWRYYPQILDAVGSVVEPWVLDLWAKVSTPAKARRVQRRTLESPLKRHRIRRITADQLFDILRALAVAVAPGTTEAAVAHIRSVSERLRLVHRQLAGAKREIARLIDVLADSGDSGSGQPGGQRDVTVLSSLPGVGQTVLATLLAEAPQALARRDYKALRCLTGVAPVTRRSGKYKLVVRRIAAHTRLRDAVYHWARIAVQHDAISKAKYAALRGRGHGHARALRSVADRPARGRLRHAQKPDLLQASTAGGGSRGLTSSPGADQRRDPQRRARCDLA